MDKTTIMKDETLTIASKLEHLNMLVYASQCTQCDAMQHYLMAEYKALKSKLHTLEHCTATHENKTIPDLENLHQGASLLGMYLLV